MGKYDELPLNQLRSKEIFLKRIANELAESNRLKRLELKSGYAYMKLQGRSYTPENKFTDEELEDHA